MWYLAEIVLAEPDDPSRAEYQCEACNVVLSAASAGEAHRKAMAWGADYASTPPTSLRLVGVAHLTTIGPDLGDGTEVCGRLFRMAADGGRLPDLVPPPDELKAVLWERSRDTPVGELLAPDQAAQLRRVGNPGRP